MLKYPNPTWIKAIKKTAGVLFVAEALGFAGSYFFWYRLNTNREFRHHFYKNYPSVLEGYYKLGEFFDSSDQVAKARQADLAVWSTQLEKRT